MQRLLKPASLAHEGDVGAQLSKQTPREEVE